MYIENFHLRFFYFIFLYFFALYHLHVTLTEGEKPETKQKRLEAKYAPLQIVANIERLGTAKVRDRFRLITFVGVFVVVGLHVCELSVHLLVCIFLLVASRSSSNFSFICHTWLASTSSQIIPSLHTPLGKLYFLHY